MSIAAYVAYSGQGATLKATKTDSDAFIFSDEILCDIPAISVDSGSPSTTIQIKTPTGKPIRLKYKY